MMAAEVKGFHKAPCDLCQQTTWHYKESGNAAAHCTNHSNWNGRKRAIPGTVMQAELRPVPQPPTERAIRIANKLDMSMWRNAEQRSRNAAVVLDDEWAQSLFPVDEEAVKDPNKLYCTFCGDEVDRIHVLSETKPVIRKVIDAYKVGDEVVVQEKVIVRAEVAHACPNCCLNIRKPVVVRTV